MNEDQVRNQVRESIRQHVNGESITESNEEEQVNEAMEFLLLAIPYGGWAILRSFLETSMRDKHFTQFMEEYGGDVISKQIPDIMRRFKLVNSLQDLETIEGKANDIVQRLEVMKRNVGKYVENQKEFDTERSPTFGEKAMLLSPQKKKKKIEKYMTEFIQAVKTSFEKNIDDKKDEILG